MTPPLATFDFAPGTVESTLEFIKRTRWELRTHRFVRVFKERLQIFDVNGDYFEIRGIGYLNAEIGNLLRSVNTAFDPETIHNDLGTEYKELGRLKLFPDEKGLYSHPAFVGRRFYVRGSSSLAAFEW